MIRSTDALASMTRGLLLLTPCIDDARVSHPHERFPTKIESNVTTHSARNKKHAFTREIEMDRITGLGQPKTVNVPLGLMTRLLIDASESNRAWLRDFKDDLVRIDSDLYEVLLAYQEMSTSADLSQRAA